MGCCCIYFGVFCVSVFYLKEDNENTKQKVQPSVALLTITPTDWIPICYGLATDAIKCGLGDRVAMLGFEFKQKRG